MLHLVLMFHNGVRMVMDGRVVMILLDVLVVELRLLVGDMLLMVFRHVLLDVNMDGLLHGDLDRVRNVFLHLHWHFLDHRVGGGHMDLDLIGHWLLDMNGHGTIIGHMDGHWHLLDHGHWHWFVHIVGHWFVDVVGHWLVDGHLHRVVDNLLHGIWLVDMHVFLNIVVYNLFDWIRSRNMNLYWHMDLLFDWVRSGHMNLQTENSKN